MALMTATLRLDRYLLVVAAMFFVRAETDGAQVAQANCESPSPPSSMPESVAIAQSTRCCSRYPTPPSPPTAFLGTQALTQSGVHPEDILDEHQNNG